MILDGRVALVTGATRGIGRAIAERLAAEGALVGVNGRAEEACKVAAGEIGDRAIPVAADVGDPAAVNTMVEHLVRETGRLDIAVNNAGVALDNFITGITDDRWNQTLATNLSGPLYIIRAVVRPMKAQEHGVILNVTSWSVNRGHG